jgi:hypothetical protein
MESLPRWHANATNTDDNTQMPIGATSGINVASSQNPHQHLCRANLDPLISPLNFRAVQDGFLQRRSDGTGQWLLESMDFKNCCDKTSETLWCHGIREISLSNDAWFYSLTDCCIAGVGKIVLV